MRKLSLIGFCSLLSSLATAQPVGQAIEHILHTPKNIKRLERANVGIMVVSANTGYRYYQKNVDHLFTPASVQKLFTSSAALSYLKPDFRFATGFYSADKLENGVLHGNLYLKFSGDPSFKSNQLKEMVDRLHHNGIKQVDGHVYIDNSAFGKTAYPPGWIWDDLSYSYAAPMNAIIIDRNKFGMSFYPAAHIGFAPRVETHLPNNVIHVINNMHTTRRYAENCPITIYSNMHNEYRVSGCLAKRWGKQSRSLAMRNMPMYAEALVAGYLRQNHIHYLGKVGLQTTPRHAKALVVYHSQPLRHILVHMLKKSDNLYTNAIFKTLGEHFYHQQGSWQNGLDALHYVLRPTGIDFKHDLLTDGAGLSRYNLITPHQLIKLLYFAYHSPTVRPSLFAALPIAGVDGTLEARMPAESRSRSVHAKTGSMTGVSALAGYVKTKHHGTVAFAIMANDFVGGRGPYIRLEDELCEALARS